MGNLNIGMAEDQDLSFEMNQDNREDYQAPNQNVANNPLNSGNVDFDPGSEELNLGMGQPQNNQSQKEPELKVNYDDEDLSMEVEPKSSSRGYKGCLLYTSPSPRDQRGSRMPSSA